MEPRRILKSQSKQFVSHLEKWIKNQPCIRKRDSRERYEYETLSTFGTLFFSIDQDNVYCYTVYMRFDEPWLVGDQLSSRFSRHSGKYNFHLTLSDPIEAAEYIIQELEELTDKTL